MPMTPLHLGLLAPVNYFAPGKVSNVSFILVNLWIDGNSILYFVFGVGDVDHAPFTHSFLASFVLASLVALVGFRSSKWILGAFYGALTHPILDMLVHADMHPFYPIETNPLYLNAMEMLTYALIPLFIWLTVQYASYIRVWVQRRSAGLPDGTVAQVHVVPRQDRSGWKSE